MLSIKYINQNNRRASAPASLRVTIGRALAQACAQPSGRLYYRQVHLFPVSFVHRVHRGADRADLAVRKPTQAVEGLDKLDACPAHRTLLVLQ